MNESIKKLQPESLWSNFADLNSVPRASKKEDRVIAFIKNFGLSLKLQTTVDQIGNVIIKKPASPGLENRPTVVLQSHLDMVHQKNSSTNFNFDTQGIDMFIDGDWVKAKGTTLGADNGIGVSTIMAILASNNIAHPTIEALFTIDEETGMTGALGLKGGLLEGRILLNLDTEDDTELTIGCAGGIDVTASGKYTTHKAEGQGYRLQVKGLTGGHSGMDIHIGRGNANKLMNRLLVGAIASFDAKIISVDGGSLRNAIPRESKAEFIIPEEHESDFLLWIGQQSQILKSEYAVTDPDIQITCEGSEPIGQAMNSNQQRTLFASIYACPNGIFRMSPDIKGLVQTSNNLARVLVKDGLFTIMCLTRSAVDSEKLDLAESIKQTFQLCGATVEFSGSYPGWTPAPNSGIVSLMTKLYHEKYKSEPHVNACHAGLECGILGTNYPGMEMISFGPNIRGAHSPDECVQISSVQKFWDFTLDVLKAV